MGREGVPAQLEALLAALRARLGRDVQPQVQQVAQLAGGRGQQGPPVRPPGLRPVERVGAQGGHQLLGNGRYWRALALLRAKRFHL